MKTTRHFTVGLGEHGHHLLILAGDEATRVWALSVQARITVVTRTVTDELVGKQLVEVASPADGPTVVPLDRVRVRFLELLVEQWPRQRFVVTGPCGGLEPRGEAVQTSTEAMHGALAMLAGYAPVQVEKRE